MLVKRKILIYKRNTFVHYSSFSLLLYITSSCGVRVHSPLACCDGAEYGSGVFAVTEEGFVIVLSTTHLLFRNIALLSAVGPVVVSRGKCHAGQ